MVSQGGCSESSDAAANNSDVADDDRVQGMPSSFSVQTVSVLREGIEDIIIKATELIVEASIISCSQIDSSKFISSMNLPASPSTDSTIVRQDNALTIDEEIKLVMSSTHKRLRGLLQITPTNLEQAYALNQLVKNVSQEYNNKKFDVVTPSKVTTKRRHRFLSPTKKGGQSIPVLKSRKYGPQFLKVGRCRGRKINMNEQLEISSTKEINLDHTSRRVQGSILQNTAEESTSHHTSSCQVRLFHENNVDPNMGGSLIHFPFDSPHPPLPFDHRTPWLFPPIAPNSFIGQPTSTHNILVPHHRVIPPVVQPVGLYRRLHSIQEIAGEENNQSARNQWRDDKYSS